MTYQDFCELIAVAVQCDDFDAFTAMVAANGVPVSRGQVIYIWGFARSQTIDAIRSLAGLSRANCSREYGIPLRTLEAWAFGTRTPPEYTLRLLAYAVMCSAPINE